MPNGSRGFGCTKTVDAGERVGELLAVEVAERMHAARDTGAGFRTERLAPRPVAGHEQVVLPREIAGVQPLEQGDQETDVLLAQQTPARRLTAKKSAPRSRALSTAAFQFQHATR